MKKEKRIILAQIQTKSNYANLNGQYITVKKFLGTTVWCEYENDEKIIISCDFGLNEIVKIKEY